MILMSLEKNRDEELKLDDSYTPPKVIRLRPAEFFIILSNNQKSLKFKELGFIQKLKMSLFAIKTIFSLQSTL